MVDSDYSAITNIEQGQSQKEATANAGFDRISAMVAATLSGGNAVVTAGNFVPTFANPSPEWQDNFRFVISGTPGTTREMQAPSGAAFCKFFDVQNDSDSDLDVQVGSGPAGDVVTLAPGEKSLLYSDGTNISKESASSFTRNKKAVRVATIVDGTLATAFENGDTVDGVTLVTGDRILLRAQSTGSENGIYTVEVSGAPTRATDFDDDIEANAGMLIPVVEGDTFARQIMMLTTTGAIVIGTTSLAFDRASINTARLDLSLGSLREIVSNDTDTSANHGGILTNDSTPSYARVNGATDKALRVEWVASNVDEVQFPPTAMPQDLDEQVDVVVHLLARMSGATDTPTIDVQVFDAIGDTEMGGATAALSATLAELTVTIANADISGNPLGFLNIALVPGAHTTDVIELYAAWVEYTRKTA